ncbi:predicted protein [Chaetoceros tenuissimus]|uniref:Uncharacterized protein n=1 Tax=Chaetoceros tenuissimus TaxID=426638 RepID=A0AAD3H9M1_9STRA|nr:predicted protein [Chaetoceros tenuissimus]GFH55337.1 predicted protein [Chaetoceros tenuissimus]
MTVDSRRNIVLTQSERKWFCSRKNKYGLNLQAICDSRKRFLDLSILFGGSSSAPTPRDAYHLSCEGQVDVSERRDGYPLVPNDLSGGGEHFDDDTQRTRRSTVPRGLENMLPREQLMIQVSDSGFVRPSVT